MTKIGQPRRMDKFMETYNIPRLNQEEIDNLNRLITSVEIDSVIKILKKKVQKRMASQWNFTTHIKKG